LSLFERWLSRSQNVKVFSVIKPVEKVKQNPVSRIVIRLVRQDASAYKTDKPLYIFSGLIN
jgi:hypothetical protein